ncbi:unnamed protein product [Effrenium voratum]|nr:unnamed protein product [Effrenium voratum]
MESALLWQAETLLKVGAQLSDEGIAAVFELLDIRCSGVVTISELIALMQCSQPKSRMWREPQELELQVALQVRQDFAPILGSLQELKQGIRIAREVKSVEPPEPESTGEGICYPPKDGDVKEAPFQRTVRRGLAGSFSFSTRGGAGRPDGMHRVLPSRSLGYHARSLGLLVLLPFSAFSSLVVLCGFCLHSLPNLFWALATVYLLLSLLFLVVRQDESSPKYWNNLGGLLFLSTMLGCGCGLWNSRMTYKYWAYQGQAKYENVKASNRATSFLDAGSLSFREDVRVDVDSAIGYSEGASTFCVAPLVDKDSTGAVQFWAAGADCCEEGFRCGATKGRLQGLVFLEDAKFTNNMVRELRAAAKAAESKHKLRGAKDALFVALVDPAQVRSFWATARMFMICACVMDFVLCLLVGLGLHCRAKELRSRL